MNYTIDYKNQETVYLLSGSVLDDLFTTFPTIKNFVFDKGNYYLNDTLLINRSGIKFRSTTGNP